MTFQCVRVFDQYAIVNDRFAVRHYWFECDGEKHDLSHAVLCVFKPSQSKLLRKLTKELPSNIERVDQDTIEEQLNCAQLENAYKELQNGASKEQFIKDGPDRRV